MVHERNLERINASTGVEYNEVNVLDTMRFNAFFEIHIQ